MQRKNEKRPITFSHDRSSLFLTHITICRSNVIFCSSFYVNYYIVNYFSWKVQTNGLLGNQCSVKCIINAAVKKRAFSNSKHLYVDNISHFHNSGDVVLTNENVSKGKGSQLNINISKSALYSGRTGRSTEKSSHPTNLEKDRK